MKSVMKRRSDPAAKAQTVRTLEGVGVPAAELGHIAPALRVFAVRIESLVRDPRNARLHDEGDLPATAASLRRFGQQHLVHFEPQTRVIKVGNGRHEAAETLLGWKWIAAVPSNLTPDELRAFALADNRTAEKSRWDFDALEDELEALEQLGVGGLDELGLSAGDLDEIDRMLSGPEEEPAGPARDGGGGTGRALADQWKIVVECESEGQQAAMLERFLGEGLRVRAING